MRYGARRERSIAPGFPSVDGAALRAYFAANPGNFEHEADDSLIASTVEDFVTNEDVTAAYFHGKRHHRTPGAARWRARGVDEVLDQRLGSHRRGSGHAEAPVRLARLHRRAAEPARPVQLHLAVRGSRRVDAGAGAPQISRLRVSPRDRRRQLIQGNPDLDPYRSNNFDAAVEFYPQSLGVNSAGLCDKKSTTSFFRQFLEGAATTGTDLIFPLNGRAATIRGLELSWQQQLTMLPAPFDDFGLYPVA